MAAGEEPAKGEWLATATHMVDVFRETRALFPSDTTRKFTGVLHLRRKWRRKGAAADVESQAMEMSQRLQRTMGESHRLIEGGKEGFKRDEE